MLGVRSNFGHVSGSPWGDVYLIGGGPSLRGFDFERLRGRVSVAVNDAAVHVPFASALFSLDATWIWNRREVIQNFAGERYLAVAEDFDFSDVPSATYLLRSRHGVGLSDNPSCVHMGGGNSGFGALNLAYLKGARRIVLLGFDLGEPARWHAGYSWPSTATGMLYQTWAVRFQEAVPQLRQREVTVWNASLGSQIAAFPKITAEDAL